MRPIRAGKIHVPLAAIGGKNNNREKKKKKRKKEKKISLALSCSELQLALYNNADPVCPFPLLFPKVFNGMQTNRLRETRSVATF